MTTPAWPGLLPLATVRWARLSGWTPEPAVVVPLVLAVVSYSRATRAVARRRPGVSWAGRTGCFVAGIAVLALALVSPIDSLADDRFSVHMVQHLLLTLVAPPLLLLGRPLTLAVAASSTQTRATLTRVAASGPARLAGSPAFGFASFALVMWTSHLSPVYAATLDNDALHALEHVAYLLTATAFWWPVVAKDLGADRLSHPGRLLYVFLSMPVMSLLGFVITSSDRVLYAHYVATTGTVAMALADQRLGGAVMWETSMVGSAIALSLVMLDWMRHDEIEARRFEARAEVPRRSVEVPGGG
jgi:cytochrome c oxidase assembly factor CtaG